jgi:hypothetical protein
VILEAAAAGSRQLGPSSSPVRLESVEDFPPLPRRKGLEELSTGGALGQGDGPRSPPAILVEEISVSLASSPAAATAGTRETGSLGFPGRDPGE